MQPSHNLNAGDDVPSNSTNPSGTRPSLIAGARIGDGEAWQRLVECYQPRLLAKCRRQGLNEAAAEDVIQNVWISVSRSLFKLSATVGRGAFRAWLWRITQRRIMDYRRRQLHEPLGAGGSTMLGRLQDFPADDDGDVGEPIWSGSKVRFNTSKWQSVLDRISVDYHPKTWQAFLRNAVDGRTTEQVAQEFNMSVVNVRQLRSRILRRLRNEIQP